jgi:hypothetical protein
MVFYLLCRFYFFCSCRLIKDTEKKAWHLNWDKCLWRKIMLYSHKWFHEYIGLETIFFCLKRIILWLSVPDNIFIWSLGSTRMNATLFPGILCHFVANTNICWADDYICLLFRYHVQKYRKWLFFFHLAITCMLAFLYEQFWSHSPTIKRVTSEFHASSCNHNRCFEYTKKKQRGLMLGLN